MDEARAALARALAESERRRSDLEELLARERREREIAVADAAARGAILVVLARELRGPMNAALSWTRFVRKELLAQSAREHALALVERDLTGSVGLIDDFLDVGGLGLDRRASDRLGVGDLLAAAVAYVDARAHDRHVAIDLHLASGDLFISGDLVRVEHVIRRFIGVAVDLAAKRTALRLRAAAGEGGAVKVAASFTPAADAPSALPRSWDDITSDKRMPSGSVVSLFLLHKLAEAQRGGTTLVVEGEQAELTVELPAEPVTLGSADQAGVERFDMLGHELRSPLQVFTVGLELLRTRIRDSADEVPRAWIGNQLDTLERAAERLAGIADRAAEMSSVTGRNVELKRETIQLRAVVEKVLERMKPELAWAGCDVTTELGDTDTLGCWDPVHVETVIGNLLSNAMKYGAGKPIHVSLRADDASVMLVVRDHGSGVRPDHKEKIFERFFRSPETKQLPGLGLGLAMTRRLVEAHGGRITVDSTPGEGAAFRLSLPRGINPFARRALAGSPPAAT